MTVLVASNVFYILFHFLSICSVKYQERSMKSPIVIVDLSISLFNFFRFSEHKILLLYAFRIIIPS